MKRIHFHYGRKEGEPRNWALELVCGALDALAFFFEAGFVYVVGKSLVRLLGYDL